MSTKFAVKPVKSDNPLTEEIALHVANSRDEISNIVLENLEYGLALAKSLLQRWKAHIEPGVLMSVVGVSLVEAASRFDPTREASFRTYLFYHLKGLLIKEIKMLISIGADTDRKSREFGEDEAEIDAALNLPKSTKKVDPSANPPSTLLERQDLLLLCYSATGQLSEIEQQILVQHFVEDKGMLEIADDLGFSRCHVSRLKTKALKKLQKRLSSHKDDLLEIFGDEDKKL